MPRPAEFLASAPVGGAREHYSTHCGAPCGGSCSCKMASTIPHIGVLLLLREETRLPHSRYSAGTELQ